MDEIVMVEHTSSKLFTIYLKRQQTIRMKLSGKFDNKLKIRSAKFQEFSISRKSYVKISILGPFFWHTQYNANSETASCVLIIYRPAGA